MSRHAPLGIVLLACTAAGAGQRLGSDDPGFVPPTRNVAQSERMVAKALAKDAACLDRCTFNALRASFFRGAPFIDEPCEDGCAAELVKTANALFARNICPPCITRFPPALVAALNEQATDAAGARIACAGTIPLGGDDPGFVAPDRATGRCELGVGRSVSTLDQAIMACHIRAADRAFRKRRFDEERCEDQAERSYDTAIRRLTGCPPCIDPTQLKTQIRANADAATALIYCASPSGAFLD
jgi:hypothetical protein